MSKKYFFKFGVSELSKFYHHVSLCINSVSLSLHIFMYVYIYKYIYTDIHAHNYACFCDSAVALMPQCIFRNQRTILNICLPTPNHCRLSQARLHCDVLRTFLSPPAAFT